MTASHDLSGEVWASAPNGASLCALINGQVGWLMFLRAPEDPGFSSRNPEYIGDPNAEIQYCLANGQVDTYPASWALPLAVVEQALSFFRASGERPPFV